MTPTSIGRYRIVGTLGEGGMGTVYEAVQDQPQRAVALKVIRPDYVSPELLRRFARESEVLGRLQHPGIAQIYEAGTSEGPDGSQSFFAMELVRGQTLSTYVEQHGLHLSQRLDLFARICDAVHYAHQQGVVHRDLKPANIMVDASGQPKILDFGVARLTNADAQATRRTTVGEVIGTLQYMSPEQVNADPADVDARSDVYSLGVILYELVSGKPPYDLAKKLIFEAVSVILSHDPAPLSSIDRRLAGDVEIIVGKSLEKEKERRYHSANELASDIRRFLRDEPIIARPASALYQLRKFARRNRALVGGIGIAAAILVVGTAVSVWQAVRATAAERLADSRRIEAEAASQLAERRRAVADSALRVADAARGIATANEQRATGEAEKAQAINAFLQNMLASSDPENARGKELTVRELLDQVSNSTSTPSLSKQPEVRAAVEATIGRSYFGLGLYQQARSHFDSAYAIRRRTLGDGDITVAQSADELGKLANAAGDAVLAEKRLTAALATMQATLPRDDDRITSALSALADAKQLQGKFPEAEKLYRETVALARSRHGNDAVQVALRLQPLGAFLSNYGRAAEGTTLLEQAVAILRRAYGANHPETINALVSLSDAQFNRPDYASSEKTLRETLPIARTVYGNEHPMIANVLSRLGRTITAQQRLEEPESLLREALAMRIKLLGEQHPDVQLARVELVRLLQPQGRLAEADTLARQALAARRAVLGESSPAVASSLLDVGILARTREDWPAAEAAFRQAAPIWRAAKIEDQELFTLGELGVAVQRQNRLDEAETILTDVLTRRRALLGNEHWAVGDSYDRLAAVALARGNGVQAESLSVQSLEIRRKVYGPKSVNAAQQLANIAFYKEARGDTSGAIPFLREALAILAARPPSDLNRIGVQRLLATDLCATGAVVEGDSLIRAVIEHVPLDSTRTLPYRLRSVLGFCLVRARRFAEAEPMLLQAEAALRAPLPSAAQYRRLTIAWLVSLYEQWGNAAQAAVWKERLAGRP